MKKNNFLPLGALLFMIALSACSDDHSDLNINKSQLLPFEYQVSNGILSFPDEENYQLAIDYLAQNPEQNFAADNDFISYFSVHPDTEIDQIFASLISSDRKIIVGRHEFHVNFEGETVSAKSLDNPANGRRQEFNFDFDDNAFAILNGEEEKPAGEKAARFCKEKKEKIKDFYPFHSDERIKCKNVFQRFAIYNSLQVKIKKEGTNHGSTYISLTTLDGSFYRRTGKDPTDVSGRSAGGYGREYNERLYQRTRRLSEYLIKAQFYGRDNASGDNFLETLTIECS